MLLGNPIGESFSCFHVQVFKYKVREIDQAAMPKLLEPTKDIIKMCINVVSMELGWCQATYDVTYGARKNGMSGKQTFPEKIIAPNKTNVIRYGAKS